MIDHDAVQRRLTNTLAQELGQRIIELHEARAIAQEAQSALQRLEGQRQPELATNLVEDAAA
jgi:CheY-like chemotaxis protein